jgi:hypothetical protein
MNFPRILVTLAIATAICLGWWLFRPMPEAPVPVASAPVPMAASKPAPVVVQTPPPQPVQVVAPVVAPAPVEAPVPETPAVAQALADPRLAPETATTDFLRMVDSGDYVTAAETYAQIPPNMTAAQFVAALQQNPNFPQFVQMVTDTTRATVGMTPTYNDTGDVATYNLANPVDGQSSVRWRKINGQWFMDAIGN